MSRIVYICLYFCLVWDSRSLEMTIFRLNIRTRALANAKEDSFDRPCLLLGLKKIFLPSSITGLTLEKFDWPFRSSLSGQKDLFALAASRMGIRNVFILSSRTGKRWVWTCDDISGDLGVIDDVWRGAYVSITELIVWNYLFAVVYARLCSGNYFHIFISVKIWCNQVNTLKNEV